MKGDIEIKENIVYVLEKFQNRDYSFSEALDSLFNRVKDSNDFHYWKGRKDEAMEKDKAIAYITVRNVEDLEKGLNVPLLVRRYDYVQGFDPEPYSNHIAIKKS